MNCLALLTSLAPVAALVIATRIFRSPISFRSLTSNYEGATTEEVVKVDD